MTKKKLRQLRELLDELLEEERRNFARDTGIDPNSDEYARMARRYLGGELPRLGSSRDEEEKPRKHRARDSEDIAAEFESNCRALRLKLQRG